MPRFHGNAEGSRGALGCQSDGENRLRRKTRGREAPAQARRGGLGLGVQGRGKEGGGGGPAPQWKADEQEGWGCTDMLWGSVLTLREQKTAQSSCGQRSPGAATEVGPGAAGAKAGFV